MIELHLKQKYRNGEPVNVEVSVHTKGGVSTLEDTICRAIMGFLESMKDTADQTLTEDDFEDTFAKKVEEWGGVRKPPEEKPTPVHHVLDTPQMHPSFAYFEQDDDEESS